VQKCQLRDLISGPNIFCCSILKLQLQEHRFPFYNFNFVNITDFSFNENTATIILCNYCFVFILNKILSQFLCYIVVLLCIGQITNIEQTKIKRLLKLHHYFTQASSRGKNWIQFDSSKRSSIKLTNFVSKKTWPEKVNRFCLDNFS
jgi:hypothetical protein